MDLFRKKYEIFGMVEKSCVFKVGSGFIRADFKNGSLATSGVIPASFSTSDRVVQRAIESSDKFKNGIIKLPNGNSVKIGEIEEVESSVAFPPVGGKDDLGAGAGGDTTHEGGAVDFPDVTTGQAARAILSVEPYSVSMERLQRNDEIRVVALEVGVTFSNWK